MKTSSLVGVSVGCVSLKPIEWESLSKPERLLLAAAGHQGPLAFTALWFNVSTGDSFRPNWHHHYYDYAARRMLQGKTQNVIVNIPPGGTKTEFWSIHFPVYCMTEYDRVRILNTSYSKDLITENSERARSLVKSSEFREFYDFEIEKDKVDDWTLTRNGKRVHQLFSRSQGGQVTGVRGGFMGAGFSGYIAADDWDKPDDMFSPTKRAKSHTRLVNTLRSRRATSRTPILFIQQRLHVEDSTAFMKSGKMGVTVDEHIIIPALINMEYIQTLPPGIRERCIRDVCGSKKVDGYWSYWPEKESVDDLVALRDANPYTFVSQYQQNPETLEGGIFNAGDFQYFGDVEDGADLPVPDRFEYRFITSDTAQKTNEWNDWTVFAEWGVFEGRIYRMAYQREKMTADVLRREFERFVLDAWSRNGKQFGNLRAINVEDKSSGTGLIQEMEGRLPLAVTAVPRNRDKLTRAMDVQPHHKAGKVVLPYGDDSVNFEFVSEVAAFTHDDSHKHDDQTDVMIDAIAEAFVTQQGPAAWFA